MHKVLPTSVTVPGRIDARTAFNQYQTLPSSTQEPQSATNDTTPGEELSSTTKNSSSLGEDLKFRAFCFALFGWYGDSSGTFTSQELASCNACFRRLGLWLWNPRPRPDGTTLEPCKSTMEVGSEHRHYCPWTNAATQNNGMNLEEGEASLAGFETLLRVISNAARIARPRPTSVGVPHGQLLSPQDSQGQKSPSKFSTKTRDEDAKSRDEKDKKRISLMKRLSNSFRVKKVKKPGEEKAAGST